MKLSEREVKGLVRIGAITPHYEVNIARLSGPERTRLFNMLDDGVCTNVGALEPMYCALTRHIGVTTMSVRKSTHKYWAWRTWVERPPAELWPKVAELLVADQAAYNLTAAGTGGRPYYAGGVDTSGGTFSLVFAKSTDTYRELARLWAKDPVYKEKAKDLKARLENGESIWFN